MDKLLLHPSTAGGLRRIIASSPHAVGLLGEPETGKKYLSKYLAGKILDVEKIETYPHSLIVDCNEKIGIEEIRESIKFLALKIPGSKKYKRCLIFWSFNKLGREAQNALLKSLEEPPRDTVIIITTDSKTGLLPTAASRLSWVSVLPVSIQDANAYFSAGYSEDSIKKAYILSGGKPAMLAKLLDDYDNHPLAKAIAGAKELIRMDKFDRLGEVNRLNKDEEFDLSLYLKSFSKIFEAALRNGIVESGETNKKILNDLKKILQAENSLGYNASQKLILTDIFYNL